MIEILVCQICGLVHNPETYNGFTCKNPNCGGKLISIRILSLTEGDPMDKRQEECDNGTK